MAEEFNSSCQLRIYLANSILFLAAAVEVTNVTQCVLSTFNYTQKDWQAPLDKGMRKEIRLTVSCLVDLSEFLVFSIFAHQRQAWSLIPRMFKVLLCKYIPSLSVSGYYVFILHCDLKGCLLRMRNLNAINSGVYSRRYNSCCVVIDWKLHSASGADLSDCLLVIAFGRKLRKYILCLPSHE